MVFMGQAHIYIISTTTSVELFDKSRWILQGTNGYTLHAKALSLALFGCQDAFRTSTCFTAVYWDAYLSFCFSNYKMAKLGAMTLIEEKMLRPTRYSFPGIIEILDKTTLSINAQPPLQCRFCFASIGCNFSIFSPHNVDYYDRRITYP